MDIKHLNPASIAIPAFFLFLWIEYIVSSRQKKKFHRFESSVANINVGILERLLNLLLSGAFYGTKSHSIRLTRRLKQYITVQIILVVFILFSSVLLYYYLTGWDVAIVSLLILITIINCGALLEKRRWIVYLEFARTILLTGYICLQLDSTKVFVVATILIIVVTLVSSKPLLRTLYLNRM